VNYLKEFCRLWDNGCLETGFQIQDTELGEVDKFLDNVFHFVRQENKQSNKNVNNLYNLCPDCGLHLDDCECCSACENCGSSYRSNGEELCLDCIEDDTCDHYDERFADCSCEPNDCCGFSGGCFGCNIENNLAQDEKPPINPFERARWLSNRGKL